MTEAEWLVCRDPVPMLELVRGRASERKVRLLAVAFLRHLRHLLPEERCGPVLEVAERYADEQASLKAMKRARQRAEQLLSWAGSDAANPPSSAVPASMRSAAASAVLRTTERSRPMRFTFNLLHDPGNAPHFALLVRDGFANPFRPSLPVPAAVLAWSDGTVRRLAGAIYEERRMPEGMLDSGRLAILADALLDAGCDDDRLIQHCREPGPHVRGCWAVDRILAKE
jgi:hypothetical protein